MDALDSGSQEEDDARQWIAVVPVVGKGLGLVTTRDRGSGDMLALERPLVLLVDGHQEDAKARFGRAFAKLDPERTATLLSLYDPGKEVLERWSGDHKDKDVDKAWRILYSNGMEVGLRENAGLENISALYPTLSRINHSCRGNTYQKCTGRTRQTSFLAVQPILAGEEVTFNYLGPASVTMGRADRRARTSSRWFFACACVICALEGEELLLNESIRNELAKYKEQMAFITSTPVDYKQGRAEAEAALDEEQKKQGLLGQISMRVVRALGPDAVLMLREELQGIYFSFSKNMAEINRYMV